MVLPATYYLIRVVNGQIDTQGTVGDLRASGILSTIVALEERERVKAGSREHAGDATFKAGDGEMNDDAEERSKKMPNKKPRALVEEELRATGHIKWPTYRTYFAAS